MQRASSTKDFNDIKDYNPENNMDVMTGPRWSIPRPSLSSYSESGISISSHGGCGGSRGGCRRGGCTSREGGKHCRSSTSSQGSASNHSTQSASSGSLLLSAANLAQAHSPIRLQSSLSNYQNNLSNYVNAMESQKHVDGNLSTEPKHQSESERHSDPFWNHVKLTVAKHHHTRERDNQSTASSTHFTVVNGFTRHTRNSKHDKQMWCCKSSHQITVLVITMTLIFTAGILAAICYIEMRQRRDTGSWFS